MSTRVVCRDSRTSTSAGVCGASGSALRLPHSVQNFCRALLCTCRMMSCSVQTRALRATEHCTRAGGAAGRRTGWLRVPAVLWRDLPICRLLMSPTSKTGGARSGGACDTCATCATGAGLGTAGILRQAARLL